jgi:4-hydroxy-tetrahydrodipicolinate synthase
MHPLAGVHTALVTPFTESGALDLKCFERLVERQLAAGVHGLVPCGTTGETPTLEKEEWEAVIRTTVDLARGRAQISAGVGTNSTSSTLKNIERASEIGVDCGLLVLPYYNKPTAAGLKAHVEAAAALRLPLILYHVPGRTAQRLEPGLLSELCAIPGVVGCKEATGDLIYGQDLMLALKRPIAVLSGDDFTWLPLLSVGGDGVISVLSNVAPAQTVAIYQAWQSGNWEQARTGHLKLYPLIRYLFAQTNPIPAKAAMAAMGLCREQCRLPLLAGTPPDPKLLEGLR